MIDREIMDAALSRPPRFIRSVERKPVALLVDDDVDLLRLLARRLERRGYEVLTATNGRAALEALRDGNPDALVIDGLMPDLAGAELCARAKADPTTSGVAVVVLSGQTSERAVAAAFQSGADAYLTKPFDIDELEEILQDVLGVRAGP
jgi:DNA-binding response OmpR family regulator